MVTNTNAKENLPTEKKSEHRPGREMWTRECDDGKIVIELHWNIWLPHQLFVC